jgi:hypothetical protein
MRKVPRVLILWGVPGVGKTTFADWLVDNKGFIRIDSDFGGAGNSKAAMAWRAFLNRSGTSEAFMKVARYSQQPIVLEFGMYATVGAIGLLKQLRQAGAEVWWFDGDRDEAFEAWKKENRKSGRVFDTGDAKWDQVVRYINDNRDVITSFFGSSIVRTIEAGPVHVPPAETFTRMFGEVEGR